MKTQYKTIQFNWCNKSVYTRVPILEASTAGQTVQQDDADLSGPCGEALTLSLCLSFSWDLISNRTDMLLRVSTRKPATPGAAMTRF